MVVRLICFSLLLSAAAADDDSPARRLHSDADAPCPVNCFRPYPGVTKLGFCEVGSGGGGSGQALLLIHIVWLIAVGVSVLFGFF